MLWFGVQAGMMVMVGLRLHIQHWDNVKAVLVLGVLSKMMVSAGLCLKIHHWNNV